jgi:hypothetical protein
MLVINKERIDLPTHHVDLFGSSIGGEKQDKGRAHDIFKMPPVSATDCRLAD